MSIGDLLGIVAVGIAVYALLSPAKQAQLRLHLGPLDGVILLSSSFVIHFLVFASDSSLRRDAIEQLVGVRIDETALGYLAFLFCVLGISLRIRRFQPSLGNIGRVADYFGALLQARSYSELAGLLGLHGKALVAVSHQKTIRERCIAILPSENPLLEGMRSSADNQNLSCWSRRISNSLRGAFGRIGVFRERFETRAGPSDDAQELLRRVLTDRGVVEELARANPYAAIPLFDADGWIVREFSGPYFDALLRDSGSILYHEIRHSQNSGSPSPRREIRPGNRLLHYLFRDAKVAERLGVWQPVGEAVMRHLDSVGSSIVDPYNDPRNSYSWDDKALSSPVMVALDFFNIMVAEAIFQNIQWHMWLYYFPHFARTMCRNAKPDAVESGRESLPYYQFIGEMANILRGWILALEHVPLSQENSLLRSNRPDHENGNPFKSSLLALSEIVHAVLSKPNTPPQTIREMLDLQFSLYFELAKIPGRADYAEVQLRLLEAGPHGYFLRGDGERMLGVTIAAYCEHDHARHMQDDYQTPIRRLVRTYDRTFGLDALEEYVQISGDRNALVVTSQGDRGYRFTVDLS